ncbi:hypothetical protein [Variibacter gotjawalensis]|uniref:hypothetical protein n=1 Tax=Variibacter gotjawalensis TaxID=1333996 RepID=UPI00102BBE75|nr:hypothetical protein [Variibacter gotjawalensis]NIK46421.1 hypothetical protein [Variibacter gotjawalensis]
MPEEEIQKMSIYTAISRLGAQAFISKIKAPDDEAAVRLCEKLFGKAGVIELNHDGRLVRTFPIADNVTALRA